MNQLEQLRTEIDRLDKELASLFLRRMTLTGQVGEYKQRMGLPVLDAAREAQVLSQKKALAQTGEEQAHLTSFFQAVMAISRRQQHQLVQPLGSPDFAAISAALERARPPLSHPRVLYQGEPGAYSEEGAALFFGEDCRREQVSTWEEIFLALAQGKADYGVVPAENSSTGPIHPVYDLLARHGAYIVGEQLVRADHCLMAPAGAKLEEIREVYSHEQGLLQCAAFLRAHLHWKQIPRLNTAESAKFVCMQGDRSKAAIGSRRAAALYGLDILAQGISSSPDNHTRFWIVSPVMELRVERNRVSTLFVLPHRSGSLHALLSVFADAGLNLLKLESRPIPGRSWQYQFFIDFTGVLPDPGMDRALRELSAQAEHVRLLGNYKAGQTP